MDLDEYDKISIDFWRREKKRCMEGFVLGNIYIHGWLYWHTTYWMQQTDIDIMIGGRKQTFKKRQFLDFRDIEWLVAEALIRCEKEHKGFMLTGSRNFGKTAIASSLCAYYATFFDDTEVMISCGNGDDNKKVTSFIEVGLAELEPTPFGRHRALNDWDNEVVFGYKDKKGNVKGMNSRFTIRNFQNGNKTMACANSRPKFHIIDEVGKIHNLQLCYDDSKPCWINTDGEQFAIVLLAGTGGDMEVGEDASSIFFNPVSNNLLEFKDRWEDRTSPIGLFIPATMAKNKFKYPQTLSSYVGINNPATDHIMINVSDEEKCKREWYDVEFDKIKNGNTSSIQKFKAYNPLKPSEAFYVINENPFPQEMCQAQLDYLIRHDIRGRSYELFRGPDNKIQAKLSDRKPIDKYPFDATVPNPEGAVIIYEHPTDDANLLYVSACDPYSQAKAANSTSVGAFYVYKRIGDISGDQYYDMMVAHYVARPETQKEFYETCEMLMEYYNAMCMPENETSNFIDYFKNKNKAWVLADGLHLTREVTPNTTVERDKGLPATTGVINHSNSNLIEYIKEEITLGRDDKGMPVKRPGVCRILDPMLLQEMIKYRKEDGKRRKSNCDRIVAFRIALTYARYLDRYYPVVRTNGQNPEERRREEERKRLEQRQKVHSPFAINHNRARGRTFSPFSEDAVYGEAERKPAIHSPFALRPRR